MHINKSIYKNPVRAWILAGIPILFIAGSIMHFIYEWSGNSPIVGIFAPINESVWEHLKLSFWPMLIWWFAGYLILNKKYELNASRWFSACITAVIACPFVIVTFYYTYTGALGIESLILDIFSLLLGLAFGQGSALYLYYHVKTKPYCLYISIALIVLLIIIFTVFTFDPPHIPLFSDPITGSYGI